MYKKLNIIIWLLNSKTMIKTIELLAVIAFVVFCAYNALSPFFNKEDDRYNPN